MTNILIDSQQGHEILKNSLKRLYSIHRQKDAKSPRRTEFSGFY